MSEQDKNKTKSRQIEIPNQNALLSSISQVHKAGELSQGIVPIESEPLEEPTIIEKSTNSQQRKKRISQSDETYYKSTFLSKSESGSRKNVYINQELHKLVSNISSAAKIIDNKLITVGGYIDNVLAEHFEAHKEEINSSYRIGKNDMIK